MSNPKESSMVKRYRETKKQILKKVKEFTKERRDLNTIPLLKFTDEMKNKPITIYIIELVENIAIIGWENKLYKWHLQSKELREIIPYLKIISLTSIKTTLGRFIRVQYEGKIKKGKHYLSHFKIWKMTPPYNTTWVDIKTDLSYLHGEKNLITVRRPRIMGGSVLSFPDHPTASNVRDVMIKLGFPTECIASKSTKITLKQRENWIHLLTEKKLDDITIEDAVQCHTKTNKDHTYPTRIWDTPDKKAQYDYVMEEYLKKRQEEKNEFLRMQQEKSEEFERELFKQINGGI